MSPAQYTKQRWCRKPQQHVVHPCEVKAYFWAIFCDNVAHCSAWWLGVARWWQYQQVYIDATILQGSKQRFIRLALNTECMQSS